MHTEDQLRVLYRPRSVPASIPTRPRNTGKRSTVAEEVVKVQERPAEQFQVLAVVPEESQFDSVPPAVDAAPSQPSRTATGPSVGLHPQAMDQVTRAKTLEQPAAMEAHHSDCAVHAEDNGADRDRPLHNSEALAALQTAESHNSALVGHALKPGQETLGRSPMPAVVSHASTSRTQHAVKAQATSAFGYGPEGNKEVKAERNRSLDAVDPHSQQRTACAAKEEHHRRITSFQSCRSVWLQENGGTVGKHVAQSQADVQLSMGDDGHELRLQEEQGSCAHAKVPSGISSLPAPRAAAHSLTSPYLQPQVAHWNIPTQRSHLPYDGIHLQVPLVMHLKLFAAGDALPPNFSFSAAMDLLQQSIQANDTAMLRVAVGVLKRSWQLAARGSGDCVDNDGSVVQLALAVLGASQQHPTHHFTSAAIHVAQCSEMRLVSWCSCSTDSELEQPAMHQLSLIQVR
jgi:hypothetical protein